MKRFELSTLSWQGDALPLSYIRTAPSRIGFDDLPIMHHRGAGGQSKAINTAISGHKRTHLQNLEAIRAQRVALGASPLQDQMLGLGSEHPQKLEVKTSRPITAMP